MGEADRVDYERLVSRLLPDIGIGHSRPLHGIKAIDPDGSVCAAIRTTARRFDANVILFVEAWPYPNPVGEGTSAAGSCICWIRRLRGNAAGLPAAANP